MCGTFRTFLSTNDIYSTSLPSLIGETAGVVGAMLDLFQNRSVMRQENLCIDINDPLKRYSPPDGMLGEALSGSVYQDNFD